MQSRLGQLLLAANQITLAQLEQAQSRSQESGLPVGRVLVLDNVVPERILGFGLEVMIAEKNDPMISEDDAADLLKLASEEWRSGPTKRRKVDDPDAQRILDAGYELTDYLSDNVLSRFSRFSQVRIGRFFTGTLMLREEELATCLEQALEQNRLLGEVLIENGLVKREILEFALELQSEILADQKTLTGNALYRLHMKVNYSLDVSCDFDAPS